MLYPMTGTATIGAEDTDLKSRLRSHSRMERKHLLARAGLTKSEIARELGVSEPTASRWVDGIRTPSGDNLVRFVELLERLERGAGAGT
jgi:DNA-binding transcriptional regulator YiaG